MDNRGAAPQPNRAPEPKDQHVHHSMPHALANNNGGIWTCLCQKPNRSKAALNRHIAKETGQFACPEPGCSTKSGSKDDLDRHHRDKHQEGRYVCGVLDCKRNGKVFARHPNLFDHYKKMHPWHGEVFLVTDPSGLLRGSDVPMSDQSSSPPPNTLLEVPYLNIGYLEGFNGTLDFIEGTQFDARVQNGPNLQRTPHDGYTYLNNTGTAVAGLLPAESENISQAHDSLQFPQDIGSDGARMKIQNRISMLEDCRQRALQQAQEMEADITAMRRTLELMKE